MNVLATHKDHFQLKIVLWRIQNEFQNFTVFFQLDVVLYYIHFQNTVFIGIQKNGKKYLSLECFLGLWNYSFYLQSREALCWATENDVSPPCSSPKRGAGEMLEHSRYPQWTSLTNTQNV